jgi:Cu-Zn family superoxide dismutase
VIFSEENGGLAIKASFENLLPGKHAFHIHENGSCEDSGKAAGGHFNPDQAMHGFMPKDGLSHAHPGDMGNIEVGSDGKATVEVFLPEVVLMDNKYAVAGKSVIVHEKADDFSQPTGNAGGRIACGIIEPVEE